MPITTEPRSWLAAVLGLITLPTSNTPSQREILTSPVSVSTRTSQTWVTALAEYEQLPYETVLPGHGQPGGKEIYAQAREYLSAAKPLVAEATSPEQLKAALIERFPTYRGAILLDVQNMYLFPAAPQEV
jgi:hypothetical protein